VDNSVKRRHPPQAAAAQAEAVEAGRCAASTQAGAPCAMAPLTGESHCFQHSPAKARARADARRKGGHNRRTPPSAREAGAEVPTLKTAADVLREVEEALADAKCLENSARRAAAVVGVLGLALKVHEVGAIEERLAAIEERLNGTPSPLRRVG
jgi:hypothetical protein